MTDSFLIYMWIAEVLPMGATLFCFFFGLKHFFKKGVPFHLQSLTMAMGCHCLGTIYHACQTLTVQTLLEGFTPAYLGRIGFFLFFVASSFGQLDRIIDDGSRAMRPARIVGFIAPLLAMLLFLPSALMKELPIQTKIAAGMVWLPAYFSLYFNLKHAVVPDMGFGFIKAIRPYNIIAVCLGFSELLSLTAWNFVNGPFLVAATAAFSALCVILTVTASRGVKKWTI